MLWLIFGCERRMTGKVRFSILLSENKHLCFLNATTFGPKSYVVTRVFLELEIKILKK